MERERKGMGASEEAGEHVFDGLERHREKLKDDVHAGNRAGQERN